MNVSGAFSDFRSTLKNTSFDSSNRVHFVEIEVECINFDKYKEYYCREISGGRCFLRSVDAVIENGGNVYFIEFKNTGVSSEVVFEVKEKCYDSILMYFDQTGTRMTESREKFYFILVTKYGGEGSLNKLKGKVRGKADKGWREFERKFQFFYFKKLQVMDPELFSEFLTREGILHT